MTTQRLQTRTDSSPDHTATKSHSRAIARPAPPTAVVRTATDRAPKTFAQNTSRLQNLIDEFNAGFADSNAR